MSPKTKRNKRKSKSVPLEQIINSNLPSTSCSVAETLAEGIEPSRVIAQPSMETEAINEEPKEKGSPKGGTQYANRLDVMKKISTRLDVSDELFLTILEKILALYEGVSNEKALKLQVVDELFTRLETSDKEEVTALVNICKNAFFPEAFKNGIVDGKSIYSFGNILGEGGFGVVNLGKLRKADGSWIEVAIKKPNAPKHNKMCLEEAKIMMRLDHKNVIKILGFQKIPLRIAMEYMDWGNLSDALKKHHFTDVDLLNALHDVASGMEHVAEMKCVHRDLACRNVFVNSEKRCKVGDFGLSRQVDETLGFYEEKDGVILMYNTAPEAKAQQIFSTKTDVWAMGVLMWELYFIAYTPPLLPFGFPFGINERPPVPFHIHMFELTGELSKPPRCPEYMFLYISAVVLHGDPERRPTFTEIKQTINHFLELTKLKFLRDMD